MNELPLTPSHIPTSLRVGAVVLCGGQSRRMGQPKAWLPFGGEPMLTRVVRLLSSVASPLVVVAARDQTLPDLPPTVLVARDDRPMQGPLEGLRAGLQALADQVDAVYATSCDVPLLVPDFVRRMIARLGSAEVAVPVEGEFHHPLAAVYRVSVLPHLTALLDAERLRPIYLYDRVRTERVPVEELRDLDPALETLRNLNAPEDYDRAVAEWARRTP
ncbi:MAG: molybdenum cofactor guanylyltransferase [Pirellulales bacterium]